jgi:hypothetical protein
MVAQTGPADARNLGTGPRGRPPLRMFIGTQAAERGTRQFGLACCNLANKLKEQGQGARRLAHAFMLQRTMLR